MYAIETMLKTYASADPDSDFTISVDDARDAAEKFGLMRTALRRIQSLDDKNMRMARDIAADALARSNA